jgi:hypothetical protein
MKISGGYWEAFALHAAVKLDIFTAVGAKGSSGKDVAKSLGADGDAMERLLNTITAMGLLTKDDGIFCLTPFSSEYLSKDSPKYMGYMIMHHQNLVESWARLDQAVLSGGPVSERSSISNDEIRENFLMGMFNTAMMLAPLLVPTVDLTGRKRFLDLGGGPGTYSIQFCLSYPDLTAVVYDLPSTRPFAEKTIARFGMTDRIEFCDVDFTNQNIEGSYDVAWLSHILHGEGMNCCRKIIQKATDALEKGGVILIHDFILDNSLDGPLFPTLFSLNMLLATSGGRSYSENELMDMLTEAGIKDIQRHPFQAPNDSGIIIGIK